MLHIYFSCARHIRFLQNKLSINLAFKINNNDIIQNEIINYRCTSTGYRVALLLKMNKPLEESKSKNIN